MAGIYSKQLGFRLGPSLDQSGVYTYLFLHTCTHLVEIQVPWENSKDHDDGCSHAEDYRNVVF